MGLVRGTGDRAAQFQAYVQGVAPRWRAVDVGIAGWATVVRQRQSRARWAFRTSAMLAQGSGGMAAAKGKVVKLAKSPRMPAACARTDGRARDHRNDPTKVPALMIWS